MLVPPLILLALLGRRTGPRAGAPPHNPPPPEGAKIWTGPVSPEMQAWAKAILDSPDAYPMHSTAEAEFDGRHVLARVEWHTWTIRDGQRQEGLYRGVTLYELAS